MDACLTQIALVERPTAEPVAVGPHWIRWAIAATIVAGLAWRMVRGGPHSRKSPHFQWGSWSGWR